MKSTNPTHTTAAIYSKQFVRHVHYLINVGFIFARNEISSNCEEETNITGFIKKGIKINLRKPNFPKWGKFYFVSEEEPLDYADKKGKSRPRIDILIETGYNLRSEFYFEAKRLKTPDFPVRKYLGKEGIGCFIDGIYATECFEAGMLGYMQNQNFDYWKNKIKNYTDENASKIFLLKSSKDIDIIKDFPKEWITKHKRSALNNDILIYHILLDFCK